ncbi:MAG: RNA methyltransferase [Treponema sp.]|jgi:TrmH RNA methyltransferase|nr:RNA methyltransferase [Treponema sp.]
MRNKLTDELAVCGLNAVLAVGEHHPDTINRLFLREDRLKTCSGICKRLAERKRPYKLCEDEELERVCKSVHHQGVVAMIGEPEVLPLSREDLDFWAAERKTGLVLHAVGNDHNLGAIARAAAFFDVHFIVLNENDSEARLSTSAYRVAEGGMEHLTIRKVSSTEAFLKDASKQLLTLGTDIRARRRVGDLNGIVRDRARGGGRPGIALVLGNEETGLPEPVKDQCFCLLRIPGTGNIESLNVAQAAALFLYHLYEWNPRLPSDSS